MRRNSDQFTLQHLRFGGQLREKALQEIYKREWPKIKKMLHHQVLDPFECDEIFHESVKVLYFKVIDDSYRGTSTISTFLHSVARIKLLQFLKKKKRLQPLDTVHTRNLLADDDMAGHLAEEENIAVLMACLEMLPPKDRMLVQLRWFEGLPYRKVAKMLELKNGQVAKNKGQRVLAKLRTLMEDKMGRKTTQQLRGKA